MPQSYLSLIWPVLMAIILKVDIYHKKIEGNEE
jgi:hypothetical protein